MVQGRLWERIPLIMTIVLVSVFTQAGADEVDPPANDKGCEANLQNTKGRGGNRTEKKAATKTAQGFTLSDFLVMDADKNLAIQHPFTIANAAEKVYAMANHIPPRDAKDPLYRIKPVKVYPMLSGEHESSKGRLVEGNEEAIAWWVSALHSITRGDRAGKALGFPGPAGTGKTELLYVLSQIEENLGKEAKYKQFSYRWKGIYNVPYLRMLHKFDRNGKPMTEYFDPDMARSPFTLLREDMQERVLNFARTKVKEKWNMTISRGWSEPEPKCREILRRIFEHEFPGIAEGQLSIEDLSEEDYLRTLSKYMVIVPKSTIRPKNPEPAIVRVKPENPSFESLLISPNIALMHYYGKGSPLALDYRGQILEADGGLLMMDEFLRQGPELLNIGLEVIQNHIAETDYGTVHLDIVPVWNSNDESIAKAREDFAVKALLNRTESPPMRSLLPVNQVEGLIMFQVGLDRFKMRKLEDTEIKALNYREVYPQVDTEGRTQTALGRYALYYEMDGQDILIAPYTLNYVAWLASASRFVTDGKEINKYAHELNVIRANPSLLADPIERVKINIGDRVPEPADLMELMRLKSLLREGSGGISSRQVETWVKRALAIALESGKGVLTPRMVDLAFGELLDNDETFKPEKDEIRADWQQLRERVKLELLLPKLDQEVRAIVSGDNQQAERLYDQIEAELIAEDDLRNSIDGNPVAVVIPEDGSQQILINTERLNAIREIYYEKFRRHFQTNFLLRQLHGARRKKAERDPQLLEAVRIFVARKSGETSSHIAAFESLYRGDNTDPNIRRRDSELQSNLSSYGYNARAWEEAVAFVAQLQKAEQLRRAKRTAGQN